MNSAEHYLSRKHMTMFSNDKRLLRDIWGDVWGVSNEYGKIRKALMRRPGPETLLLHKDGKNIHPEPLIYQKVNGATPQDGSSKIEPDYQLLQQQYEAFRNILSDEGIEIIELEGESEGWPERTFTRDHGFVIPGGVILTRLALDLRYGETRMAQQTYASHGMPILGTVQGDGFAEGGSFMMLDAATAVIGRSERVNNDGIEQTRHILSIYGIDLITVDLPSTIIHLDEAFLAVDRKKAIVNCELLPYWFLDHLLQDGYELIHVDPKDPPLTINVLPIAPGRVIIASSGVRTIELLEKHGVKTIPVEVSEIYKLGGGIHCLALPLVRD